MTTETLFMPEVTLNSKFPEIFGDKQEHSTDETRRARWAKWLRLARQNGNQRLAAMWTDNSACRGCVYLRGAWCQDNGLPCTVNPILTFYHGRIGMACMGAGYTPNT